MSSRMSETAGTNETSNEETTRKDSQKEDVTLCPDGGWGWVVCFVVFFINFTVAGIGTSNGIILLGLVDLYNESISNSAMVGSIYLGSVMCAGPLVLVFLTFQASHRQVIITGGALAFVSTIISVFAPQLEVLYFTYGILAGCSNGMAYFAGSTILASYFKKKRSLAVGIAFFGGGCGVFAFNYLVEISISFYGMRGTFLLMSGFFLNFIIYGYLCRPLNYGKKTNRALKGKKMSSKFSQPETNPGFEPDDVVTIKNENETIKSDVHPPANVTERIQYFQEKRLSRDTETFSYKCKSLYSNLFDPMVFKNRGIQLLLFIYFVWSAGEGVAIFLPANIVDVGLSRLEAALVMSIYGVFFAFGQLMVGVIADLLHVPISYIFAFSLLGMAVVLIAIPFCFSFLAFAICASVHGTFNGLTTSLRVLLAASILGVGNLDKCYSPVCLLTGVGYIAFPLISGQLFNATRTFSAIFYFDGGVLFLGFIASIGLVYMQVKGKFHE